MLGLRLLGYLAFVVPGDLSPAPGLGATAFALIGPLEIGASLAGNAHLFSYSQGGIGGHVGVRVPIDRVELDAAATLGYGEMKNGGGTLLSSDPGASGESVFVGARGGVEYVFYRSDSRSAQLGLALIASYEHDLDQRTHHYSYEETGWLFGDTSTQEGSARVGMDRTSIQLAFDLGFN